MRILGEAFAAHLATGATTLATCWRIERTEGAVLGFTDHDAPLSFEGVTFLPAHGLDAGEGTSKLGPQVDTREVMGAIHSAAIAEEDIALGRYAGARVETWRVNWRNVAEREHLRSDTIGEIVREDGVFRAELRSLQQALNVPKGRIYQSLCDARLGDARCRVDLNLPIHRAPVSVFAVRDRHRLAVSGLEVQATGAFAFGQLAWAEGRSSGLTDRILRHTRLGEEVVLAFEAPVGDWVVAGDAGVATAGCDGRFATCRGRFGNHLNFRGFPHVPGTDFVLRYPKDGDVLDGRPLWR